MYDRLRIAAAALVILAASVCLVLGLTLPVVKLSYMYFWTDSYSLTSIVKQLYDAGELFLASVIFMFSIVFPALKLVYLLIAFMAQAIGESAPARLHRRLAWLGKWSMLDVLVLALVVFYAKSTQFADAAALPGVYLFAASVLLTMIAYGMVEAEAKSAGEPEWRPGASHLNGSRTRPRDSAPS